MVDIAGNVSTTTTVTVGSTTSNILEQIGDHDWFRVNLTAGQSISVTVNGVTLEDSYLWIRNSSGALLFENDDANDSTLDSSASFAATYSGAYYIDVGAFNDAGDGTYQLSVQAVSVNDIPGNASTTASVTVGGSVSGDIELLGDHDWFRINLTAGQAISVTVNGVTLADSFLQIRNSTGTLITENDDLNGASLDSRASFAATYSGVYYIDVSGFEDSGTGTYQVTVAPFVAPPVGTVDQFVTQLVSGYYGGTGQHFQVSTGGSLTVNVTALTASGQTLARDALALWSDVIGVRFAEVTSGGQIIFDDSEVGASTEQTSSGGFTTSARVNVSTQWLSDHGTGTSSYSFQTYVHEIGHALGLGHSGNYNETAAYPFDALYANDSWPVSVMSYFDQTENTYFANLGFNRAFAVTPMLADIAAMSQMYGLSTTTRADDTTYGFNSTAGRAVFDANMNPAIAYTVFDSGGIDTLDYSGFSNTQRIDLNSEMFSDVGGRVGTVTIARGTTIENAVGGSGADTIIGNAANNLIVGGAGADIMTGGAGADLFRGTVATLNADRITDLTSGDQILLTDANAGSFTFSLTGSTLTYSGGSMTLNGVAAGALVASAAAGGGVVLAFASAPPQPTQNARNDFNGDGRSDILWRDLGGTFGDWLATPNDAFSYNGAAGLTPISTVWQIAGTGDFNGDGRSDILWRNGSTGEFGDWLANASGGFAYNGAAGLTPITTAWVIAGTGDFNGDGRDDILWRNSTTGEFGNWLANSSGAFAYNAAAGLTAISNAWRIDGTGDFNGDGRDDILWRNTDGSFGTWLANAGGGFAYNGAAGVVAISNDWHIVGTGDFNGDGRDDILWRSDSGAFGNWLANASGGFAYNAAAGINASIGNDWDISGIGDYNGDGRDDILWRNDSGAFGDWLSNASGAFAFNAAAGIVSSVGPDWQVQAPDLHWA